MRSDTRSLTFNPYPPARGAKLGNKRLEARFILSEDRKDRLLRLLRRGVAWGRLKLPFGLRSVVGLLLVAGGFLAFLPVFGVWMIPLGLVLVALDVPPLRRRLRAWLHRSVRPRRRWRGRTQIGHHRGEK